MSKYKIKLDTGIDTSITLVLDAEVIPPDVAHSIVEFWSGEEAVMEASDGDVYEAVARFAAPCLIRYLVDGWNERGAANRLEEDEGWPSPLGISVTDYELPDLDPTTFDVVFKETI